MKFSDLVKKAERKVDLSEIIGEKLWITVKLYPVEVKGIMAIKRANGIDKEKLVEAQKTGNQETANAVFTADYPKLHLEYQRDAIIYGLDSEKHNFVDDNNVPVVLDADNSRELEKNPVIFEAIIQEIEKFNTEYSLGEASKPKTPK
jgi:hypothetical protein